METPPPPPPPQQPTPPAPVVIPARDGLGCFAKGCLIVIIGGVLLCGALFVGGWYILGRAVGSFTATEPADVRIENVSDADLRAAEDKLNRLGQATASNQETTIEFTANELNAMIAREPLFADLNNHVRVAIADSILTLEVSAPLGLTHFPRLGGRWFNGTARVAFSFSNDEFVLELKSGEANGHVLPREFFVGFAPTLNSTFNRAFHEELGKNSQAAVFWNHIRNITVSGDKLVVTTQQR